MNNVNTNLTGNIEYIPFSKLTISAANVRTISAAKSADKQLVNSIATNGLLQNLVVTRKDGQDVAEVIAGGRRFGAFTYLVSKGELPDSHLIPCSVRSEEEAVALSLVENQDRADMHLSDRLSAYNKLLVDGLSEPEIAKRFGVKVKEVKQVLRLANVHQTLFGLFRKDKLSVDQISAFACNPDQGLQLSVWKSLGKDPMVSPYAIKREMNAEAISANSGIVRFVGLDAYRKAGGSVVSDLFTDDVNLTDRSLLTDLAEKKMELVAQTHIDQGWKWATCSLDGARHIEGTTRLSAKRKPVPEKLQSQLKNLHSKHQEHEESCEEWTDKNIKISDDLEAKLNALEEKIEQNYTYYADAVMKRCGVAISFNSEGLLYVVKGLQRSEDAPKQRKKVSDNEETENATTGQKGLSQALSNDLGVYRRSAIAASVAKKPALAVDILNYSMVRNTLEESFRLSDDLLMLRVTLANNQSSIDDYEQTVAGKEIQQLRASLETEWMSKETGKESFNAFSDLSKKAKDKLLAYCCAVQLYAGTDSSDGDSAIDVIVERTGVDFKQYFRPSSSNYFSRLNKTMLTDLGTNLFGSGFADSYGKKSKKEIVDYFSVVFESDSTEGLSPVELKARKQWIPKEINTEL